MTHAASGSQLRSEFNNFLHASVGDDKSGMLLSVLSLLARQNVDPWEEAADLALLPREAAVQRLSALIPSPPEGAPATLDSKTAAARLIALLPRLQRHAVPSHATSPQNTTLAGTQPFLMYAMMLVLAMMLGRELFTASSQPPGQIVGAHVRPGGTDAPKVPLRPHTP